MRMRRVVSYALPCCLLFAGGCATGGTVEEKQAALERTMQMMKSMELKGGATMALRGSPFALHMSNSFELGSKQSDIEIHADFDFTRDQESDPEAWRLAVDEAIGAINVKMDRIVAMIPQ